MIIVPKAIAKFKKTVALEGKHFARTITLTTREAGLETYSPKEMICEQPWPGLDSEYLEKPPIVFRKLIERSSPFSFDQTGSDDKFTAWIVGTAIAEG